MIDFRILFIKDVKIFIIKTNKISIKKFLQINKYILYSTYNSFLRLRFRIHYLNMQAQKQKQQEPGINILNRALKLYDEEQYKQASVLFKSYIAKNQVEDAEIYFKYADSILSDDDLEFGPIEEVEIALEAALRLDRLKWEYFYLLGVYYLRQTNQLKKAIRLLKLAQDLNGLQEKIKQGLQDAEREMKMMKEEWLKDLQKDPSIKNLNKYAQFLQDLQEWEEAEVYYLKALKIQPKNFPTLVHYQILANRLNDLSKMEQVYSQAIIDFPKQLQFYLTLIRIYDQKKELEKALEICQKAESFIVEYIKNDQKGLIFFNLYTRLLVKADKMTEVRKIGKKYSNCGGNISEISAELGRNYMIMGKYQVAEQHFLTSLQQDPQNVVYLSNYAILLQKLERDDEAENFFKKAIKIQPNNLKTNCNYAGLLKRKRNFKQAEDIYKFCLSLSQNPIIYHNYAWFQFQMGDTAKATEYFQKALKLQGSPDILQIASTMRFSLSTKNKNLLKKCMDLLKPIFEEEKFDQILRQIVSERKVKQALESDVKLFLQFLEDDLTVDAIINNPQITKKLQQNIDKICQKSSQLIKIKQRQDKLEAQNKNLLQQNKQQQSSIASIQTSLSEIIQRIKTNQNNFQTFQQQTKQNQTHTNQKFQTLIGNRQKYQARLTILSTLKKQKSLLYAQTLTSMLIHTLLAYNNYKYNNIEAKQTIRSRLGQGINTLGSLISGWNYIQGNSLLQGLVEKIGNNCLEYSGMLAGVVGVVGNALPVGPVAVISAFSILADLQYQKGQVINKIHGVVVKFLPQQLTEQVCGAVLYLIEDIDHLELLQAEDPQPWLMYQSKQKLRKGKQKINCWIGIQEMPEDEQKAGTDCTMILKYLLKCPNDEPKPVLKAAQHILNEKKQKAALHAGAKRRNTNTQNQNQKASSNPLKSFCLIF